METVHGRPEEPGFTLHRDGPHDGELVARVAGTLDAAHGPEFQAALLGALREAPDRLVVDLSGVTFFGSAGVTALVWVSQHPEATGKGVRVVATSRIVTGPLEMTGLLLRLDVSGMPPESVPPADPTGRAVPPSA
ncbi:STAS domain-containing protein [Klenkia taihuensis]|uniref:Anti-sigma B factor antagonist n=1 Tax=Klenkia taihuensis TaxID=1225127 RepID=A0A1I1GJJ4_9ACTN|nr:STAS domain-containing protein [Klenkia taihuensis]GHE09779.1 anti-anti-sigma factor [Klenkia taihuensis]SFC10038.1 anti-sigma B factor antagonist [Klenkia taihuensis]